MDTSSLIGNLLTVGLVSFGIWNTGVGLGYYWDIGSLAIVVGGSIGSLMFSLKMNGSKKSTNIIQIDF